MHDVYTGFERVFMQIAATIDASVPSSRMASGIAGEDGPGSAEVRPTVLSNEAIRSLDEYLRFRHVVRNVYTFSFDPERIGRLVTELDTVFEQVRQELSVFADFLEKVSGK
jgi:hypothetical protein